jgi:tripeptidyl-peptidase-1
MAISKLLTFLSIIAVSAGSMVLHESRPVAPAGFVSTGTAPANEMITLRFGLAGNNVAGLEEKLMSISTPGSHDFRQWLSKDEVSAYFCVSQIQD